MFRDSAMNGKRKLRLTLRHVAAPVPKIVFRQRL
jgi:hypothetical protein